MVTVAPMKPIIIMSMFIFIPSFPADQRQESPVLKRNAKSPKPTSFRGQARAEHGCMPEEPVLIAWFIMGTF